MFHVKHLRVLDSRFQVEYRFPRPWMPQFVRYASENRVCENFRAAICAVGMTDGREKRGGFAPAREQTGQDKRRIQHVWSKTLMLCSSKTA
jgi:hypothetical protein